VRYVIEQDSVLAFPHPVREHHCELWVMPAEGPAQRIHAARLAVDPQATLTSRIDYFDNTVHHCDVVAPHAELVTHLHVEVDTLLSNPFDYPLLSPAAERAWLADALKGRPRLWDYVLHRSERTPEIGQLQGAFEWPAYDPQRPLVESVQRARDWIADTLVYEPGEPRDTLDEVLAAGTGSANDFAHLFVALVRSWRCAARYVRGYVDPTNVDDDTAAVTPHAWAEVLIPGAGWRGFDPTTRLVVNDSYIAVAAGRDHLDVPLHRSTFKGDDQPAVAQVSVRLCREAAQQ
jgi:transglutaminase-like putative cysteine protease